MQEEVIRCLSDEIGQILTKIKEIEKLQEIRLRKGLPFWLRMEGKGFFPGNDGNLWTSPEHGKIVSGHDMKATISKLSSYSLYAFEDELRQGFLTIEGGHRVGFCGKAVLENGTIKTLHQISSINIRIARQVFGCADMVLPYLLENNRFLSTVLVSPPGCGKTTLLRELVRQLSQRGFTIAVADERGEIAGMCDGVPQMDLGPCTDIMYGCPKGMAMEMLLRSMSPDIIAADELGRKEEYAAVEGMLHGGVGILCTVHGMAVDEIQKRELFQKMTAQGMLKRFVFLSSSVGCVGAITDENGKILYNGKEEINGVDTSCRNDLDHYDRYTQRRIFRSAGKVSAGGFTGIGESDSAFAKPYGISF